MRRNCHSWVQPSGRTLRTLSDWAGGERRGRPIPSQWRAGVRAARGALAALATVAPLRTNARHSPARDTRDRAAEKSRFSQQRNCPWRHSNEINPQESENQMFHYSGRRRGWKIRLGRSYIKLTCSMPPFNFYFHKGTEIWSGRERGFFLERQTARGDSGAGASCPAQRPHRTGRRGIQPATYPAGAHGEDFGFRGYSEQKLCIFKYWILVNGCT